MLDERSKAFFVCVELRLPAHFELVTVVRQYQNQSRGDDIERQRPKQDRTRLGTGKHECKDQRTDKRIDFVGGIRGLKELEKRVNSGEMKAAFSFYPVTIEQLFDIADSGKVMPPKSTWFEPKLRDGLLTHLIYS